MSPKRIKMVQSLKIPEDKLALMQMEVKWYSKFEKPEVKQKLKFTYKRITKILFAEYFLSI